MHICQMMVILLVITYMSYNGDDVCGCVVEYVHSVSYVHARVLGCLHLVEVV